ncbi:hypothetical protein E4P41_06710 [Geodermatophilus sp. DF01-2]|uniref:hypothetical protein n=1 Tax=Geodermatophilus sp. DF01-2 TaxID=2559610 RepID=UPI001073B68C|nr:hypothetical protein [Geodermatophilus sp. DF01_2]TFV62604.1 hypothetical protein E4P41_06710 [Geodermatophilus sp. DF01_2]
MGVGTEDGVRLAGVAVPSAPPASATRPLTFVAVHGLTGSVARASFLRVVPGSGHAESGATAPLVERIGRWASATIDP